MDFSLTSDQQALRSSIEDIFAKEATSARVRAASLDGRGIDQDLWKKSLDLGWAGLIVPEDQGGVGLGWVEAVLLAEQLGYTLAPIPYFSQLTGIAAVLECGDEGQRSKLLPELADGSKSATIALWEARSQELGDLTMKARSTGEGFVLDGTKMFVTDAGFADVLLIAARSDEGSALDLFAVDVGAEGVTLEELPVIDSTRRQWAVSFHEVRVDEASRMSGDLAKVRDRALILLAAECSGIARRCLELCVEYSKSRTQFDKPIGAYQAVSHKVSDMFMLSEHGTSLTYRAAWTADHDEDAAPAAAWQAMVWASDAAKKATADAIQVHGGIGFTWEHDLHLYFKRARANATLMADSSSLKAALSLSRHG